MSKDRNVPGAPSPSARGQEYSASSRFARLAAGFEELRALDAGARRAALVAHERDDPALAAELAELLAHHDDDPDALATPDRAFAPQAVAEALREAADAAAAPAAIGPYRVDRLLGHGGMGTVYLGHDDELRRDVALKVLRTARHDPAVLGRFRTERRILGSLRHPNIATLYEAGTTDDGQPWVAMEYVDGLDLVAHCEQRGLGVTERLGLFVKVCRAVAHAHRALVVHRDLKPGNVLVDASGEPKLLDFGIAKLLDADGDVDATRTALGMMTPAYCAPEQVRGERVTTATDVYALGVVLYELLTGLRAQPGTGTSMRDLVEVVCDRAPAPPSQAVLRAGVPPTPRPEGRRRWARRLEGDLDTVVAAAMQKDPARRYATAAALADDLERHLRGLPVTARPDTFGYRASKFVRRNRLAVAVAALLLATLVTFAVVTAHANRTIEAQLRTISEQNVEIRAERDAARNESAVSDRVVEFLVSLYDMAAPDPDRARTLRARELLDRGARRIQNELSDLPKQRVPLQLAMGRAYLALGLYDDAAPLFEEAEADLRRIAPDTADHREAQFMLGGLHMRRGAFAEGERLLRASWQPTVGRLVLSPPARAARRATLAGWLRDAGRFDDALALLAEARDVAGERLDETARVGADVDLIEASVHRDRGDLPRALELTEAALARAEARDGPGHGRQASLHRELGKIHQERGDYDAALAALERTLEIDRELSGDTHPDVDTDLFAVAMVRMERGEWRDAAELLREILRRDEARFGPRHPYPALTRSQLAGALTNMGEFEAAERHYRDALALQRDVLPEDHPELATTLANLASLLNQMRRADEALPLFEEALAIRARRFPPSHPTVLTARNQIAVVELERGNAEAAEAQFREVLAKRREVRGEHAETAGSLLSLATCLARQGRAEEALPLFAESIEMFRRTLPPGHETTARPLLGKALAHVRLGRADEAVPLLEEADRLRTAALGEQHHRTLYTRYWLARSFAAAGRAADARRLAAATRELLQRHFPDDRLLTETERLLEALPR